MLDRKTIRNYLLTCVLFFIGVSYLMDKQPGFLSVSININFLYFIFLALLSTTYFFVKSFSNSDNILLYYALPFSRQKINIGFLSALIIDTIIRKMSIIFIFLFLMKSNVYNYCFIFIIGLIVCNMALVCNSTNILKSEKTIFVIVSLLIIASIYFLDKNFGLELISIAILLIEAIIYCLISYFVLFKKIIVNSNDSNVIGNANISNYFLKFIFAEKIYWVNTLAILSMMILVSLLMPKPINIPLALAVATINSPLLTIFSTEKGLKYYAKMLPSKFVNLSSEYLKVLSIYFAIANLLVLAVNYKDLSIKLVTLIIIACLIDIIGSFILENKFNIQNQKTNMDIWKHPRKYILSIIVFIVSFIGFVII
ncbi:hypothetical protein [Finegoldia magna]|nr:hypothetical protein [Finegoldia magna]